MSWLWHVLIIAVIQKQIGFVGLQQYFCSMSRHITWYGWNIPHMLKYYSNFLFTMINTSYETFVNNHLSLVTSIIYQLIFESLQDHKRRPNRYLPCKSSGSFRFRRKYFLACRIIPQTCGIDQVIFSHFRFNKIRICIKMQFFLSWRRICWNNYCVLKYFELNNHKPL